MTHSPVPSSRRATSPSGSATATASRNYRNVYSNGTSNYDIETYIDQLGFTVTDDPAKADIIVGNVALDQGEGRGRRGRCQGRHPLHRHRLRPAGVHLQNLVTDLTYHTTLGMEALHAVTYPTDSLITASYAADGDYVRNIPIAAACSPPSPPGTRCSSRPRSRTALSPVAASTRTGLPLTALWRPSPWSGTAGSHHLCQLRQQPRPPAGRLPLCDQCHLRQK